VVAAGVTASFGSGPRGATEVGISWAGFTSHSKALQLLARLTLNTRNDAANQPARLAQLDDGMIVLFWSRATRDLLKSFGWGIAALVD